MRCIYHEKNRGRDWAHSLQLSILAVELGIAAILAATMPAQASGLSAKLEISTMNAALMAGMFQTSQTSPQEAEDRHRRAMDLNNNYDKQAGALEQSCRIMEQLATEHPENKTYNSERNTICAQQGSYLGLEQRIYNSGISAAQSGDCTTAGDDLIRIRKVMTANSKYRDELDAKVKACKAKQVARKPLSPKPEPSIPKQLPSSRPPLEKPAISNQALQSGLHAYFLGDYENARNELTEYLDEKGDHQAVALFFRGASEGTQYFLSGDNRLRQLAVADFQRLQGPGGSLSPRAIAEVKELVSPRIWDLYLKPK